MSSTIAIANRGLRCASRTSATANVPGRERAVPAAQPPLGAVVLAVAGEQLGQRLRLLVGLVLHRQVAHRHPGEVGRAVAEQLLEGALFDTIRPSRSIRAVPRGAPSKSARKRLSVSPRRATSVNDRWISTSGATASGIRYAFDDQSHATAAPSPANARSVSSASAPSRPRVRNARPRASRSIVASRRWLTTTRTTAAAMAAAAQRGSAASDVRRTRVAAPHAASASSV